LYNCINVVNRGGIGIFPILSKERNIGIFPIFFLNEMFLFWHVIKHS